MNHRMILKDAYKGYTLDLEKTIPPDETVRRFKKKLKKINLSILKNTVRIDNGRLDIPVYFSICGHDAEDVIGNKKQMGKGGTTHQAEASAVMELAERFSLFSFYKDPKRFIIEEYRNIERNALPFNIIAQSVHEDSFNLDKAHEVFSKIPLKWTWGYNLTRDEEVLVPFNWFFAINEHNGPASGNCIEEAILQGICEVVERHVSSIISRNRLKTPAIDLGSVTDPLALELIQKYHKSGIKLYVSDFSLNTGIPTVGILAHDPSTFPEKSELVWTAGTTPNPQKALIRTLTEVAQLAGDFNTGSNYVPSGLPKFTGLTEADFVVHPEKNVSITSLPDLSDNNIRVEVENLIAALSKIDMEVIVVDVTHPELEVPVIYTIIPGTYFRERAAGASVGLFSAKLIAESGDPEWAIEELKRLDRLLSDKYYIKFFLGLSYLSINEQLSALSYFEEALELEPEEQDIPSIYYYMGVCFKDLERYRETIEILEKAEKYDKGRTEIYNLMGFCYFKLKEHEKAIQCFQKVIQLDPGSAIDYANIASNYRDMRDREKAIYYYRLALELDPNIDFAKKSLERLIQENDKKSSEP